MLIGGLVALLLPALFAAFQMRAKLNLHRGFAFAIALGLASAAWTAWHWPRPEPSPESDFASDPTEWPAVEASTCAECHPNEHRSWHRSFHRSMTREATPENVKAKFDGSTIRYENVAANMTREGDLYYLNHTAPGFEPKLSVDRIVGSHWFQQFLHRMPNGTYIRLPLAYHIVEQKWLHINGAFLMPDKGAFFSNVSVWNNTCIFCHNTRPSPNPVQAFGGGAGFETEVGELGISCEACHGAGAKHVWAHRNPGIATAEAAARIVHPLKLPNERADQICARCHGGTMPCLKEWNRTTFADPFLAGRDLHRYWFTMFSEAEMKALQRDPEDSQARKLRPQPDDGRFWGDGTPLTTALEYQGMTQSACYENGRGKMTCLTCHSMHKSDPNHQVKEGMRTNAACVSCHPVYGNPERLREHSHHAADSSGSQCQNCHMPHQVFSLLDTHRSHRIAIPRVRDSIETGKPHACNLCHLDKSLGWTQDALGKWYGTKPEPLPEVERKVASSVMHLMQSDARSRAVMAGAFASADAQKASGTDWAGPVLLKTLERERYQAVRYLAFKALRSIHGNEMREFDFQATGESRDRALEPLRAKLAKSAPFDRVRHPFIPADATGLDQLLKGRRDPDVEVNE